MQNNNDGVTATVAKEVFEKLSEKGVFEKLFVTNSAVIQDLFKRWAKEKNDFSLRLLQLRLAYSAGFEEGERIQWYDFIDRIKRIEEGNNGLHERR